MATSSVNTLEDLVTCNICSYKYDEGIRKPKFLPCSHTICLECFQTLRQGNTVTCPFCRKRTSKDNSDGAEWILPTNQYVLELLKFRREPEETVDEENDQSEDEDEAELFMSALALAVSSREMELQALNESFYQSVLDQECEEEDEEVEVEDDEEEEEAEDDEEEERNQFMTTLGMRWNSTEMEEMEALNEAMHQSLLSQQQEQKIMVTAAFMEPSKEEEEEELLMMALAISGIEM